MVVVELGVLIYQGAQLAAVHGLTDLFGVANRIAAEHRSAQLPLLRVSHWQVDALGQPLRVFDSHPGPDQPMMAVLVPPSIGEFTEEQTPPALLQWLREQHATGTVLGGVCIGSIMLARSGLLDGRSATTHWSSAQSFAARYPAVRLEADKPIVGKMAAITHVKREQGLPRAVDELIDGYDTPDMIRRIKERYWQHDGNDFKKTCEIRIYPDASGDSRKSLNASITDLAMLKQAGFAVIAPAANPPVKDRINAMNAVFCNAQGERRYLINPFTCPTYADGLEQQVWGANGEPDKTAGIDLRSPATCRAS